MRPAVGRSTLIAPEMGSGQGLQELLPEQPWLLLLSDSQHTQASPRESDGQNDTFESCPAALPGVFPSCESRNIDVVDRARLN
jgi:hypothetical protein